MANPKAQDRRLQEEVLEHIHHRGGGRLATIISALALAFSGYSFYEAVLRAPELAIYVPPRIAYTDPDRPDSPFEVFIIPVTLANDGARSGTVLSLDELPIHDTTAVLDPTGRLLAVYEPRDSSARPEVVVS